MKNIVVVILFTMFFAVSGLSAEDSKRPEEISHIGTVTYTKTAGKYTYIQLDENGKEVWLATMPIKVSAGDKVEYIGGLLMKDFHSNAMNKTFDSILLITRIRVLNENSPTEQQDIPDDEYHKNIIPEKKNAVSIPKRGEIVKVENGKTIEEIFLERGELRDKEITLRAKVIKVSSNILDKNWITLHDGTGIPPDDKLIAITSENVNVDDILTVKGIVKTDVNIGAGYSYKVLLEDAKFTK